MHGQLYTNGPATSDLGFGKFGDPVSNGKPAGGIHVNASNPRTPGEAQASIELAGARGALSVHGELFWLLVALAAFGFLNYRARR